MFMIPLPDDLYSLVAESFVFHAERANPDRRKILYDIGISWLEGLESDDPTRFSPSWNGALRRATRRTVWSTLSKACSISDDQVALQRLLLLQEKYAIRGGKL